MENGLYQIWFYQKWKIHLGTFLNFLISSLKGVARYQWPDEVDGREREDSIIDGYPSWPSLQMIHQLPSLVGNNSLEVSLTKPKISQLLHTEILLSGMETSIAENQTKVFSFDWPRPECGVIPEANC